MKEITIIPVLQTFAAGILPYSATLMAFSATAHQLKTLGVKMNLQYAPFCQEVYSPRCLLFTQNAGQQNWLQALCNAGMALELSLLYLLDLGSADLPVVFRWVSDIQTFCSAAVSLSAGTTTAAAGWAWRCWGRSPAAMSTPGPASSVHCSTRALPHLHLPYRAPLWRQVRQITMSTNKSYN